MCCHELHCSSIYRFHLHIGDCCLSHTLSNIHLDAGMCICSIHRYNHRKWCCFPRYKLKWWNLDGNYLHRWCCQSNDRSKWLQFARRDEHLHFWVHKQSHRSARCFCFVYIWCYTRKPLPPNCRIRQCSAHDVHRKWVDGISNCKLRPFYLV